MLDDAARCIPPGSFGSGTEGGSRFARGVLIALGLLNLVRGGIHLLAEDGGAGRIAGIELAASREVIVFLFAALGLQQLAFGAVDLAVALRFRVFVPLWLGLETLKQALAVGVIWIYKPLPVAAPGKYGALVLLPLLLLAWLAAWRAAGAAPARAAATSGALTP